MNKETFQRYALVTIVVLLAAIASQQVMAYGSNAFRGHQDHDVVMRHVNVELFANERGMLAAERHVLAEERRMLVDEGRALAHEARQLAEEGIGMHDGVCDLSAEARNLRDRIRVEIR